MDLTITVPAPHVDELRRELLRAHAARAVQLQRALDGYLRSHEGFDAVEGAVVELADLDAALRQIGWAHSVPARSATLTAHPELLVDALRALVAATPDDRELAAVLALVEGSDQED